MAETDAKGAAVRERPLSPHMSVWRWHVTMVTSILHRATGVALYVGALIGAAWAMCLAGGARSYDSFLTVAGSPLGKLVLFGLTVSIFYHLANGIRHLFWDAGEGFEVKTADKTAIAAMTFAVVISVLVWGAAMFTGGLV